MQPVRTHKNQYRGINAHLHSLWQAESGWAGFHTVHIGDLYREVSNLLEPLNYIAEIEDSLQIRRIPGLTVRPRSDLLVYDTDPLRFRAPKQTQAVAVPRVPALDLLAEDEVSDKQHQAIVIYELSEDQAKRGEPVVWIEVLSPTNKAGDDADVYHRKRMDVLLAGLVFVEIDYLHETRPTFAALPTYLANITNPPFSSHPYRITLVDPRPNLEKGWGQVFGFAVDEPIPSVNIPLHGDDSITLDFGLVYTNSIEAGTFTKKVNYAALPVHFDRYSPADQARIARRMLAVLAAAETECSNPPLPVQEALTLEEALGQIAALTAN
jgi:hypothetical protein